MEIKRFIVVSCEHTDSFDGIPQLMNSFDTRDEAKKYVDDMTMKSLDEFQLEEEVEEGVLQTFNEAGAPDYGYVLAIIDTRRAKPMSVNKEN